MPSTTLIPLGPGAPVLPAPTGPRFLQRLPLDAYHRLGAPWREATGGGALFTPERQSQDAAAFRDRYLAPWDGAILEAHDSGLVLAMEARMLGVLGQDLTARQALGPNHRPIDHATLQDLKRRLPPALETQPAYQDDQRAVIMENTAVRLLPTAAMYLRKSGQGYPFDLLQNSVLWAGTPVYLLQETLDGAWSKVLAPDCCGWIRSQCVARVGSGFVRNWRRAVAREGLTAVRRTEAPVLDTGGGRFLFHTYVGAVFPRWEAGGDGEGILVPVRDAVTGLALSRRAILPEDGGVAQPWAYTPGHAAALWETLLTRPYGWGNVNFHNDCSAELKAFFAVFGLWMPRHTSGQARLGAQHDLSHLGVNDRLQALSSLGQPYRTLVWFSGHIMLYLGPLDYRAANGAKAMGFMSYQNLWAMGVMGLPEAREIVGGSVLFPVLDWHPEAPDLHSLADRDRFVLTQL